MVPAGYRGIFKLVDAGVAEETSKGKTSDSDERVHEVPENGILRLASTAALQEWHSAKASFSDGSNLEIDTSGPVKPYDSSDVKMYYMARTSEGTAYFFVGSEQACAKAMKSNERKVGNKNLGS